MSFLICLVSKPCTYLIRFSTWLEEKHYGQLIKPVETKSLPFVCQEAIVYTNPALRAIPDQGRQGELD